VSLRIRRDAYAEIVAVALADVPDKVNGPDEVFGIIHIRVLSIAVFTLPRRVASES